MKLLIDMNLSPRWVKVLADAGLDSAHWSALGEKTASDADIMAYARAQDYVVLTHDLDFGAILAATRGDKPSVVLVRAEDASPEAISQLLINALRQMQLTLEQGALLTVDPQRTRLRVLPLLPRKR